MQQINWTTISGEKKLSGEHTFFIIPQESFHLILENNTTVKLFLYHPVNQKNQEQPFQIKVDLEGTNSKIQIFGLTEKLQKAKVWEELIINHNSPSSFSECKFWSILAEQSEQILNAKILINQGQINSKTDYRHWAMLMSPTAKIQALPSLEIKEKSVQAAHGVSIGQFDSEKLFYFQCRGFTMEEAQKLIEESFADQFWLLTQQSHEQF